MLRTADKYSQVRHLYENNRTTSKVVNEDGYLPLVWQYNNENPPEKIFPYLVQKRGSEEKTFDVSMTGKSTDYRGVPAAEFIEKLIAGEFPESASVRMKPMNKPGSQGNGWLIRDINIEPTIYELARPTHRGIIPLEPITAEFGRRIKEAHSMTPEALNKISPSYPTIPEKLEVVTTVFRRNPYVVIEVLRRTGGICEGCGSSAPFKRRTDGSPYLEVHHKVTLADGGEDTAENAIALCPNCHRAHHYG